MLALNLLRHLNRTLALVTALLMAGMMLGMGLMFGLGGVDHPALRWVFGLVTALALGLGLAQVGLLLTTGSRVAEGRWRVVQTILALFLLATNPPVGTAYALFALWVCWVHPEAEARLAGQAPVPPDATADAQARRYHRLAHRLVLGFGILYSLLVAGIMGPLLAWTGEETTVVVRADTIELDGMYGERIERSEIRSVALEQTLPTITLRTNGYALGGHLEGWFSTKEHGTVKLFVHTDVPPFLYIHRDEGLLIYGADDPERTRALHTELTGG